MTQTVQSILRAAAGQFLPAVACATAVLAAVPVSAAPITVNVTQTVLPANCDLALQDGDMTGGTVDFGTLRAADLSGAGQVSASKTFNLALSNCGVNATTVAPHITVTGASLGTGDDAYLFKTTGTSDGLGFIFRFNGTTVSWASGGADAKNMQPGDDITTTANTHGAQLPVTWLNQKIPVAVAVSTGARATQVAGDLQASVTFSFEYR
ncbi:fimbrial protein [Enterobacter ludwigii]|uniref:fimbrial protein n=1 Tax=Enterobacter ludwigii TaxID=299767 RepID=UPI002FD70D10